MPVKFQFLDKATQEIIPLNTIDALLRKENLQPPNSKEFCTDYMLMTLIGVNIALRFDAVTKSTFNEFLYENSQQPKPIPSHKLDTYRKYLLDLYTFRAWR